MPDDRDVSRAAAEYFARRQPPPRRDSYFADLGTRLHGTRYVYDAVGRQPEATTALWEEIAAHRDRLVRLARRRLPSLEMAEEVVQEAMVRAVTVQHLDAAFVGPFLTTVTMRLCADVYRRMLPDRSTRRVALVDLAATGDLDERLAVLEELLRTLPEGQRAVLTDRALGLSVTQIAARHSLTYKATESALSRARAAMRRALAMQS